MPEGIDGAEAGKPCPHNSYLSRPDVYANRDATSDTVERLFRLVGAADAGLLVESELDPLTTSELLSAKGELNRQDVQRQNDQYEKTKIESEVNREKGKGIDFDKRG